MLESYIPATQKSLPTPNISNLKAAFWGDQGAQQNLLFGENPSLVQSKDSKELFVTRTKVPVPHAPLHPQHTCLSPREGTATGGGRGTEQKRLHLSFLERTRVKHYPHEGTVRFAPSQRTPEISQHPLFQCHRLAGFSFPPKKVYILGGGGGVGERHH